MEWMNRGPRPGQPAGSQQPVAATSPAVNHTAPQQTNGKSKRPGVNQVTKWTSLVLLFSVAVLIIALVASIVLGGKGQERFVDKKNMQAVFLNGGQVYFGKIGDLNSKYLSLSDIYYLRVNQQVQPNQTSASTNANDISLVKLGCELHGPQDRMVINQSQVIFWENLKSDGQVAKAVADYIKQNPNGQQCSQQTSSTDNGAAANTNPAPTATTPTTTPTSGSSKSTTPSSKK